MVLSRIRTSWFLFSTLALLSAIPSLAIAPEKSLDGVWKFTLTGVMDGSAPGAPGQTVSFSIPLVESGPYLFGTLEKDRFVGLREGNKVTFKILAQGVRDADVKAGGIQNVAEMNLTAVDGRRMKGDGLSQEAGEGAAAFETFSVDAVRTGPRGSKSAADGIDWCHLALVNTIVGALFSAAGDPVVKPCDLCTIKWDGAGLFAFGEVCPGSATTPFTRFTCFIPWESTALCSSRDYDMTISAGKHLWTVIDLLNTLNQATDFLQFLGFPITPQMTAELVQFQDTYGDFAFSLAFNYYTDDVSLYVALPDVGGKDDACQAMEQTQLYQAINAFAQRMGHFGGAVNVYCGPTIHDTFTIKRSVVPDPTMFHPQPPHGDHCTTPIVFLYLLGTMDVTFN